LSIHRKLVKNLENVKVEYDGTVRNADGRVLQFRYGDDGSDGQFTEHLRFPIPEDWRWTEPELRDRCADVDARDAVKAEAQRLESSLTILEEFGPVLDVMVDPPTLWARSERYAGSGDGVGLEEALAFGTALLASVSRYENLILDGILGFMAASRRIVLGGATAKRLSWFRSQLEAALAKATVAPGEMVGVVAAQSISEPATQM